MDSLELGKWYADSDGKYLGGRPEDPRKDGPVISLMLSNSGLSLRTILFHFKDCCAILKDEEPGDGGWDEGVYLRTMSVQRWKTFSVICKSQLTARRKAISFWLISKAGSPEILLQAREEKFLSCRYFEARMSADKNIRRPHCRARNDCVSSDCSMVKSILGTKGLIKIR